MCANRHSESMYSRNVSVLHTVYTVKHILTHFYTWQSQSLLMWPCSEDTGSSEGSHCEWQPQVWPWYEIQGCSLRQWGMSDAQVGLIPSPRHVSVRVCIYVCCWPENQLLPYESCCNPEGEIVPSLFFPSVLQLGLLDDIRNEWR